MPGDRSLRTVEFCLWVGAATAVTVTASLALGFLLGGDLLTGKYVLFVVGFLLFGAGSLLVQPSRPADSRERATPETSAPPQSDPTGGGPFQPGGDRALGLGELRSRIASSSREHRFEARIQAIGPLADHHLPVDRRIGRGYKVFATSLLVLAVSLAMELAGVHV